MIRRRRSQIRDYQAEARLFASRAIVAFFGIVVLMGLLVANMYNIQVNQFQDYQTRSNDNRIKVVPIAPNRGLIYDRNGVLLAENRPVFNLELTPEKIKDIDATIQELQTILEITPEQIERFHRERKRTRRFKSVPLLTQLNEKQVAVFSVNQYRFPGVEISATLKRYYPYGEVLTHVIGYVSRINDRDMQRLIREEKDANYQATRDIGKLGIEKYYEDLLHGTAGYQEVEVNSRGRVIRTLKYVPPVPGKDIVLNLDINLQLYVHQLLDGRRGSAIVLDPRDNGVLAMVSSPSYDPNAFVHGISGKAYRDLLNDKNRPLVNRTTLGIYPPASTIKPFMAVAALQEGVITPNTTRNDPGYWRIPNSDTRPFRDWLRWGHGRVDVIKSIEESVDTFYYQIAYDLGIDRISNWMMMFGFGDYTGIDIYEESKANMPTRDWKMSRHKTPWYKGDTIPVGIGQGYWTATPMQIAKATSVLVNNGAVSAPHLLKSTIDNGDNFEEQETSEYVTYPPIQNVPEKYWDIAKEGMRRVNHGTRGTARRSFYNMSYQTAGKSGTAQVFGLGENEEYNADEIAEHLRDHALFTGFAPFDDPKVIVTLVLENAGGGSSNGGPMARKIFDRVVLGPEEIKPEDDKTNAQKEVTR
ncbi:penicillin-binding protein 2 [Vibrio parahaemolyticus]|uniref:Peptidoglycan D,D-transpeptidase MrdA n=11 Tax=Vibrionaceae TaxID=641 RepID=A0A0F2IEI5_VIBPH|nr:MULTISPECIES: penicillin-binding protein 2 [Vibrio]EFO48552.1 penicillin-binding protein 2 [Vibrio parahaemolyticus K5030]EJG0874812.1 penicillin-binding protein 2 [Vibrio parahaemolyticus O3]EJG0903089.1 penicillin-binding protein 2 [Vibrio parahaemolyticus O3:K56]EJG0922298.1 penicillin-binding protein 2 [Vibrio parahaemolyticus O1:K68]EJG0932013.1 penicillin-binding protein 2 [Vibrio parahaemolyticus O1]EJG0946320.1 penicillin-binding protein 2 [Vibrio parahaemolyticus O10]EJG1075682.1